MISSIWSPRFALTPAIARGPTEPARARVRAEHPSRPEAAVQKASARLHEKSTSHLYLRKCIYYEVKE